MIHTHLTLGEARVLYQSGHWRGHAQASLLCTDPLAQSMCTPLGTQTGTGSACLRTLNREMTPQKAGKC